MLLAAVAVPAHANFLATYPLVYFDPATSVVTFSIQFNEVPDFQAVDQFGRQANEFQVMTIRDGGVKGSPDYYDAIVRGGEIHTTGEIVIRAPSPLRADGPWGDTRLQVPFTVLGTTVTFSAPLAAVAPSHPNGRFDYEILALDYGRSNQNMRLATYVVGDAPEPETAVEVACAMLVLLIGRRVCHAVAH